MSDAVETIKEVRSPTHNKHPRHATGHGKAHGGFDHRSENMKSIAKKGGSGGRNWGRPGEELDYSPEPEPGDPIYDPDEDQ